MLFGRQEVRDCVFVGSGVVAESRGGVRFIFLRRHDPMMYCEEVSRGPMKICCAVMSGGLGGIWYLEVSSIWSWTCLEVRCGVRLYRGGV